MTMNTGINLTITEKPINYPVELDFSKLTWADLLAFQKAQGASEEEAQQMLADLVTRLTGIDAMTMPASVAIEVAGAIVDRIRGGDEAQVKN